MSIKTPAAKTAKSSKKAASSEEALKTVSTAVNTAIGTFKIPATDPDYGDLQTVTSMRLKRREVIKPYYGKFYMPDSMYVWLNQLGITLGVTWDEVLRGLCEQHRISGDQVTGLRPFVPALN